MKKYPTRKAVLAGEFGAGSLGSIQGGKAHVTKRICKTGKHVFPNRSKYTQTCSVCGWTEEKLR